MIKDDRAHYLYWIKTKDMRDFHKEGYVGVTINPEKRFRAHKANAKGSYFYIHREMKDCLNSGHCGMSLLDVGDYDYIYDREFELRPDRYIGWNTAEGGDRRVIPCNTYYSGKMKQAKTLREWSALTGIKENTISTNMSRGFSLDQSLGLSPKHSWDKEEALSDCDKIMAVHLLENTLMTPSVIARRVGFSSDLKRVLNQFKLPKWIFTHSDVTMSSGTWAIRMPRSREITSHVDVEYIYEQYEYYNRTIGSLASEYGKDHSTMKRFVEGLINGKVIRS